MQDMMEIDRHMAGKRPNCVRHIGPCWVGVVHAVERSGRFWNAPTCCGCRGHGLRGVRSAPRASSLSLSLRRGARMRFVHALQVKGTQSWLPPRLRCLPGKSTSGCTTRMWRVSASLREKVFSSTQRAQRTFCLRALWIVSS